MRKLIFIICMVFAFNVYAIDFTDKTKEETEKTKVILERKKSYLQKRLLKIKKELEDAITKTEQDIADADIAISIKP